MRVILFMSLITLTVLAFNLKAQEVIEGISPTDLAKLSTTGVMAGKSYQFDSRYEGVKGSVYFNEDWQKGAIFLSDGRKGEVEKMNFNIYENELEFARSENYIYSLSITQVDKFTLESDAGQNLFVKAEIPGKDEPVYMLQKVDGNASFYEVPKVTFKEANYQGAFPTGNPYDEYVKGSDYYVRVNDQLTKVSLNKKGIKKAFPGHQKELQKYIKRQNLRMKEELDWIKTIEYFNSLDASPR